MGWRRTGGKLVPVVAATTKSDADDDKQIDRQTNRKEEVPLFVFIFPSMQLER